MFAVFKNNVYICNMNKKYTKEMLESVVKNCTSWRQLILHFKLKETGGNYSNLQNRCKEFGINTSHFTGQGWNKYGHPNFGNNIDVNKTLILRKKKRPSSKTKELVLNHKLKPYKCEICGITEWLGNPITLQLHHINGNPLDDRLENLQILCPNCHSQTDSYYKRQEIRKSTKSINSNIDEGLST